MATIRLQCNDGYTRTVITDEGNTNFDVIYSLNNDYEMDVFDALGDGYRGQWVNADDVQCMDSGAYWMWNGLNTDDVIFELDLFPDTTTSESPTSSAPTSAMPTGTPTEQPTASPTIEPSVDPTGSPTMRPSDIPSTDPTASPSKEPTVSPSADPTMSPSADPTAGPSTDPTATPTMSPSSDPTVSPSSDPTTTPTSSPSVDPTVAPSDEPSVSPTTPAPLHEGELMCGQIVSGDYNDDDLIFEVRMTHDGDMIFDASASDFEITSLEAFNVEAIDDDGDGIITMTNLEYGMDIYIQMTAVKGTYGSWTVSVICTSDSPTKTPSESPSADPTVSPSTNPSTSPTAEPSDEPSMSPTNEPSTEPTVSPSLNPSVDPTKSPTEEPTISPTTEPTMSPSVDPTASPTTEPSTDPTAAPSTEPTAEPTNVPTVKSETTTSTSTTTSGLCHDATYQGSMSCDGDSCDALWGGESMVSANCQYLLTMEMSGNLVLYEVMGSRRRLLQTLISGWSSGTAVSGGVPKLTLFKNPFQSGIQIYEMESYDDTNDDPPSLWSVVTESPGDGITFSLTDDAAMDLSDADGSLWTESATFDFQIAEDTDSDTASNAGDAANAGPTAVTSGEVSNQWWFWMMLLLSVVIIAVTIIFKCSCKRNKEEPVVSVDAMEMTSKTMSLSPSAGDAGSTRGLPQLPPESPLDVTEVSPHSLISPRSPTAGHIAALSRYTLCFW